MAQIPLDILNAIWFVQSLAVLLDVGPQHECGSPPDQELLLCTHLSFVEHPSDDLLGSVEAFQIIHGRSSCKANIAMRQATTCFAHQAQSMLVCLYVFPTTTACVIIIISRQLTTSLVAGDHALNTETLAATDLAPG